MTDILVFACIEIIIFLSILVCYLYLKYDKIRDDKNKTTGPIPEKEELVGVPTLTIQSDHPYKYLTTEQMNAILDYADNIADTVIEIAKNERSHNTSYTLTGTTDAIVTITDGEVSIKELLPTSR